MVPILNPRAPKINFERVLTKRIWFEWTKCPPILPGPCLLSKPYKFKIEVIWKVKTKFFLPGRNSIPSDRRDEISLCNRFIYSGRKMTPIYGQGVILEILTKDGRRNKKFNNSGCCEETFQMTRDVDYCSNWCAFRRDEWSKYNKSRRNITRFSVNIKKEPKKNSRSTRLNMTQQQ